MQTFISSFKEKKEKIKPQDNMKELNLHAYSIADLCAIVEFMKKENKNPSLFKTEVYEHGSGDRDYNEVRIKYAYNEDTIETINKEIKRRIDTFVVQ